MRFASLSSGSAANATFVSSGGTRILVDCGLSVKELTKRMALIGERPGDIDAIVLSHSHGDHASGIGRLAKWLIGRGKPVPIYLQRIVETEVDWYGLDKPPVRYYDSGDTFTLGALEVSTITTPHDCPGGGVSFTVADNSGKVGIATDLGFVPPALVSKFRTCDLILLESNYDEAMLDACDRPPKLKERIMGRNGHLSNAQAADFLRCELAPQVQTVIIGHISGECNTTELAFESAFNAIRYTNRPVILLAIQDRPTSLIEIP